MKRLLVLVIALLLTFTCFACGGGNNNVGGSEKINITVAISGESASETKLMQKWKAGFESSNSNINIVIKNFTGDYSIALTSYESSPKTMPDIIWTTGEQHVLWSEKGVFVNLKSKLDADREIDLSNFYDSMIAVTHKNSSDDGIYFIPRDYNKCVIVINRVVFKNAGFTDTEIAQLKDGWNYAKFLDTCERLRTAMDNNLAPNYGVREEAVPLDARMDYNASYMSFLKDFGATFVESNGKIDFSSPANLNAYGRIYELIEKGYIAPQGKMASASFTNVRAAMRIDVRPNIPSLPNTEKYDIDFLPLPLENVGVGCSGYAITKVAKDRVSDSSLNTEKFTNEDYAYKFLKYIVSEVGQKIGAETGSIVPVLKTLKADSSWTNYKSSSLNHSAFVSNEGKDFNLNVYNDFAPIDAAKILVNMGNVMAYVLKEDSYSDGGKTANYGVLKSNIATFQNAVASFTVVK